MSVPLPAGPDEEPVAPRVEIVVHRKIMAINPMEGTICCSQLEPQWLNAQPLRQIEKNLTILDR